MWSNWFKVMVLVTLTTSAALVAVEGDGDVQSDDVERVASAAKNQPAADPNKEKDAGRVVIGNDADNTATLYRLQGNETVKRELPGGVVREINVALELKRLYKLPDEERENETKDRTVMKELLDPVITKKPLAVALLDAKQNDEPGSIAFFFGGRRFFGGGFGFGFNNFGFGGFNNFGFGGFNNFGFGFPFFGGWGGCLGWGW
jgi:hypothetical protein